MIKENIVISDSNIFFDLIDVDLLNEFFKLPVTISTTDFVIGEILKPDQLAKIDVFIKSGELAVASFNFSELKTIAGMQNGSNTNVSMTDCSCWYYAKSQSGRLLTGDGNLRKEAEKNNVAVSGILFVFDNLVESKIITEKQAAVKLSLLVSKNPRLPHKECQTRIDTWNK